jgi:replicative DNA helicase
MPERILPHDITAEKAVLGGVLVNPEKAMPIAYDWLSDEAAPFYKDAHQVTWDAMVDLYNQGVTIDLVTLRDELQRQRMLDLVGSDMSYLALIADEVSTAAGVEHHASIVADLAQQRTLCMISNQILSRAGMVSKADELSDLIQGHLDKLALRKRFRESGTWKKGVHISNIYDADRMLRVYGEHIKNIQKNVFRTGVKQIDSVIRGVAGGELLVLLARAGSFKTAFLQNMLLSHSKTSDIIVPFFSIEMPVASVTERFHQIVQGAAGRDIEEFYQKLPDSQEFLDSMEADFRESLRNLLVIPTKVGIMDVVRYVQLIEKKWGKPVGAIGIDYIGLMEGKGKDAYAKTSGVAVSLKAMAKALNLPVVVISQTSRAGGHGEVEIEMNMARDSGAIEEAADFVIGMYSLPSPSEPQGQAAFVSQEEDEDVPSIVIAKILKNRKGPKNRRYVLDLEKSSFRILQEATPYKPVKDKRDSFA